jgi:hypothetical protein
VRVPRPLHAAAALAAIAAVALRVPAPSAAEPQPQRLTIIFTADVGGYLEPCG